MPFEKIAKTDDVLFKLPQRHVEAVRTQCLVGRQVLDTTILVQMAEQDLAWRDRGPAAIVSRGASPRGRRIKVEIGVGLAHAVAIPKMLNAKRLALAFLHIVSHSKFDMQPLDPVDLLRRSGVVRRFRTFLLRAVTSHLRSRTRRKPGRWENGFCLVETLLVF